MSEVKWIKIVTDIFDDEKIRYIETMPNGDTTIVLWFRILCLAGRSNRDGLLMMTDKIHYTDEMLAAIFNRDIKTVQLALQVFENLGMIEITNNSSIVIANWNKHQNVDGMERIREQNRIRNIEYRERKRDVMRDVTMIPHDETDIDKEREQEKEIEYITITNNDAAPKVKKSVVKDQKHKHGMFKNVLLTDKELEALQQVYENYEEIIQYFDAYIEEKGYKTKSHYLAIRRWVVDAYERDKRRVQ